jgi:hypothetical protein
MTAGPTTCEKGQFSLNKYKSMVEGSLDISDFILDIKLTIIWKGDGIKIHECCYTLLYCSKDFFCTINM